MSLRLCLGILLAWGIAQVSPVYGQGGIPPASPAPFAQTPYAQAAFPAPSYSPPTAPPAGPSLTPPLAPTAPGAASLPQGERQIVAGVEIIGNGTTKEHEVQRHLHTRKDREFDPQEVQGDVRRLISTGLFRDVRTFTRNTAQGVIVTYELSERPRVEYVRHLGNRGLSEKALIKEHGIKKGAALSAFDVEEGRRKMEEHYHREGYPHAQVSVLEGDRAGDKGVVYVINEGQLERIAAVSFEGNQLASDAQLRTKIESKPGYFWYFFGGKVDREKIDRDVETLTAYYRSLGYFRARIGRDLTFDDAGKWITLKFIIDEGPRYQVRNVSIEGMAKFRQDPVLAALDTKPGKPFNQAEMNRDVSTLIDLYGSQGHVFADIQAEPRFLEEPGQLDLVYRVKEGDAFRVGDINIKVAGEFPHTRDTVIINRLSMRPGDILDSRKLRDSERRLKSSQLFETNPQQGEPPRIVVKPPELDNLRGVAGATPASPTIRGQSPETAPESRAFAVPQPPRSYYYPQPRTN